MTKAQYQFVDYASSAGVGTLTLDRPPVNVINIVMLEEIQEVLDFAAEEEDLKVLLIRAEGKYFSAGVDVAEHTPDHVEEMIPLFDHVCRSLAEFPLPTVAVVNGHALGGGCEIVICSDFAFMVEGARIGQPEIQLASMAPIAALRLPLLVGPRWSAWLLFSGEPIDSTRAEEIGLIHAVSPASEMEKAIDELTNKLTQLSAAALRVNKKGYLMGLEGWEAKLDAMEALYLQELMRTEDALEGLQAFMEKRKPIWTNQ